MKPRYADRYKRHYGYVNRRRTQYRIWVIYIWIPFGKQINNWLNRNFYLKYFGTGGGGFKDNRVALCAPWYLKEHRKKKVITR